MGQTQCTRKILVQRDPPLAQVSGGRALLLLFHRGCYFCYQCGCFHNHCLVVPVLSSPLLLLLLLLLLLFGVVDAVVVVIVVVIVIVVVVVVVGVRANSCESPQWSCGIKHCPLNPPYAKFSAILDYRGPPS